jgi:hypothetical protein
LIIIVTATIITNFLNFTGILMKKLYIVLSLCVLCVATSVSVSARTNSSMSSLTQLSTNITNETIYTDARETIEVCIPVVPYSQDQFHIEYKYTLTHRQSEAERSWQTNNSCRSMLIPFE